MKRIYLIIILILLLIIDNTILPSYFIGGVYPSFLFVFAMAYSIIRGKKEAVFIGIASGLLQDLFFFSGFGINLFLNTLLFIFSFRLIFLLDIISSNKNITIDTRHLLTKDTINFFNSFPSFLLFFLFKNLLLSITFT